ncbi:MAG: DUF4156 domain-containing protein [Jannaschia sp.]
MTELTPEAMAVRQITPDLTNGCRFLGPVSGSEFFGWTQAGDAASALNQVRNDVAARGGNAFVLTQTRGDFDGTITQADAYLCS